MTASARTSAPGASAGAPRANAAFENLLHREEVLRARLSSPEFLANKGLGNEVGIYIFCYEPSLELEMREVVKRCVNDANAGALPCAIHNFNLYDILLDICEQRRILSKIAEQEQRRGLETLQKQLKKIATPEAFVKAMRFEPRTARDAIFVTGVGEVYPLMRAHNILDNIQHVFHSVPVVLFYPGQFSGTSLSLFGALNDGNYYRAFDLM